MFLISMNKSKKFQNLHQYIIQITTYLELNSKFNLIIVRDICNMILIFEIEQLPMLKLKTKLYFIDIFWLLLHYVYHNF